jgi:hypothetical protein
MKENYMNTTSNINAALVTYSTTIKARLQQAIDAAHLKAAAERVSSLMLNEKFSESIEGILDIEYEAEIRHTPKGLSNFVRNPIITFYPNDTDKYKHIINDDVIENGIQITSTLEIKNACQDESGKTKLEPCINDILNFVEDEIQPEIYKYIHQAKRKNGFTKSIKKNGGKNTEKSLQVMKLATSILIEKFDL